jgi:serine/threonine protein kinase/Tol biopolymer transport system component
MALSAGTQLDGYEILGLLGAGGMGEVYRALDPVLKREVAIKVLPSSVAQNLDRLRRFELEAQATAALDHPNILAIYRFGIFEGTPYLVSALLEGSTLRQLLESGPLPVRKAIDTGIQVAHGLAAAHEKGIVHRDLKPENIFVTKSGLTKILDFGLAKLMQAPTGSDGNAPTLALGTDPGTVMGTAGYMTPEQVRGLTVDHRTDIFAFGAILYEMLSGRRAFSRSTAAETMTAVLHEDPPDISQLVQITQPGLQRVMQRCLEKNPEQRFQSASDLAFALEALSESSGSSPKPFAVPAHHSLRKPILWSTALIAVLAMLLVGYFSITSRNRLASLHISDYAQITHDGNAGGVRGTDGTRLYMLQGIYGIGEVAISGGDVAPVRVALSDPVLLDVSPDGAKFLVASFKGATRISHPIWSASILGGSLQYLAVGTDASWSPDGNSVAYSTPDGDIFAIRSDGTGAHKLASVGGLTSFLRWSPDGTTIRFSKEGQLWEMSSNGSNLHPLLPGWKGDACCGHWAPDGSLFFFNSGEQLWARDERHGLFRRSQPQPIQVTSGPVLWGNPIPSKDGRRIFVTGATLHGELIRFDSHTGQFQTYLGGLSADNVTFSNDGQSVVFTSYPDGILWRARPDGSNRIQLTNAPMQPVLPRWSPDDTQILFLDISSNGNQKAYIVSSQGGSPQRLLLEGKGPETDPNWSPDGRKVVFSNSRDGGGDPNSVINILDLNTKRVSTIPGSVGMFSPRWSPDGHMISGVGMNSTALHLFDLATQKWSTPYKQVVAYPTWSKDGHSIYFMNFQENPAVFRIRLSDSAVERIADLKDLKYTKTSMWMGLDSTDAPLFLRDLGTSDVYALSLEGK